MSNNKIRSILAVIVTLAIGSYLYNLYGKSGEEMASFKSMAIERKSQPKKIKIAYIKDTQDSDLVLNFIQDKKIFYSKYNLDVEQIIADKGSTNILLAGQSDLLFSGPTSALSAYYNDNDPILIANAIQKFNTFGVSRFPKEQSGLIRKAIIPEFGKEIHLIAINALKNIGADPTKVELISLPSSSGRIEMLQRNEADFTVISSEQNLVDSGIIESSYIYEPEEIFKDTPSYSSIITTKKVLEQKPQELKSFVFALYEGLEYMSDNPEEVLSYIKDRYKLSDERSRKLLDRFIKMRKNDGYVPTADQLKDVVDFVKKEIKPSEPGRDIGGFIYSDFAKEAVDGLSVK